MSPCQIPSQYLNSISFYGPSCFSNYSATNCSELAGRKSFSSCFEDRSCTSFSSSKGVLTSEQESLEDPASFLVPTLFAILAIRQSSTLFPTTFLKHETPLRPWVTVRELSWGNDAVFFTKRR